MVFERIQVFAGQAGFHLFLFAVLRILPKLRGLRLILFTLFEIVNRNFFVAVVGSAWGASCSPALKIIVDIERIISNQIIINLPLLVALWNWDMIQFIQMHFIVWVAVIDRLVIELNIFIQAVGCVNIFQFLRINFWFSLKSMLRELIVHRILVLINLRKLVFILQLIFALRWNSAVSWLLFSIFKLVVSALVF